MEISFLVVFTSCPKGSPGSPALACHGARGMWWSKQLTGCARNPGEATQLKPRESHVFFGTWGVWLGFLCFRIFSLFCWRVLLLLVFSLELKTTCFKTKTCSCITVVVTTYYVNIFWYVISYDDICTSPRVLIYLCIPCEPLGMWVTGPAAWVTGAGKPRPCTCWGWAGPCKGHLARTRPAAGP